MKTSSEKCYQKHVGKELGIEEEKLEIKKEFVCQQGYKSKFLVIHCITSESEIPYIKLMEIKSWNGNHTKCISFKKTNTEAKLGTLHFENMNNVQATHEVLEKMKVMETLY